MITTNIDKKALVEKLLKDSTITIDEAFMLLDESAPVQMPYIIPQQVPQYPYYPSTWPWDWFHMPVICSDTVTVTNPTTSSTSTMYRLSDGTYFIPIS